jgi:hypothetical protein
MEVHEFLESIQVVPKSFRKGQYLMNKLASVRKDLHKELMENGMDPFYDDRKLLKSIEFIKENW